VGEEKIKKNKNNNRNKKNNVFNVRALLNAQKTGANVNTGAPKSSLPPFQSCSVVVYGAIKV